MAKLKKAAALLAAAVMACSAAGCSDTSYTVKADDEEIRAGIYIDYMLSEMSYQIQMMYYYQGVQSDFFSQKVDGKDFSAYLSEKAMTSTKEYVAITKKFEELGLSLTDDELKDVNSSVNDSWDSQGDLYEAEGISKDSMKAVYKCTKMRQKIFDYYYAEGGVEAVSNDELQTYVNDNYLRYKTITISKSTSDDEDTKKSENEANAKLRDEYLAKAEGLTFDEFDSVIDEYNDYKNADSSDDSSSSAADESTSEAESSDSVSDADSSAADSESSAADSSEGSASDDSQASDESTADTSSDSSSDTSSDSSSDGSSEEEDPYKNETMVNYGSYDEDSLDTDYGKLLTEINGLEVGKAAAYENDSTYYIIIKGDVSERTDYTTDNKDTILQQMKSDDFQSKIDEWVSAIKFTNNDKAIKRYTPETVYEKQNEYYKSVNG